MAAAAEALKIVINDPQPPTGEETTHDNPVIGKDAGNTQELLEGDKPVLIKLVRDYRQSWSPGRRLIVRRVQKAFEFFKGNHFISFDPDNFEWFDALDAMSKQDGNDDALDLRRFATNFYQMLGFAFVSALSPQLPKTRFMPEDAESEQDIATAKAASKIQQIIERQNRMEALHIMALLLLWMAGSYFRHTRYIVDAARAGTHKEPVITVSKIEILPARFLCQNCGATVPADQAATTGGDSGPMCSSCYAPLDGNSFYPPETAEHPIVTETKEVPNGMVAMSIYSALHVDARPGAHTLHETPTLTVDQEVDIASLRESYPDQWDVLKTSTGSAETTNERQARLNVVSEGGNSNFIQETMPTLSRTWIQPWALNAIEDKDTALRIKKLFPKGCLLVNVGDTFLEARESSLTKEWTHGSTVEELFGLYPPAVGDPAIPLQECINDVAVGTHDYMDMISMGMLLYNSELIDGEALNKQPIQAGRMIPVKLKRAAAPGNTLEQAVVHIQATPDPERYSYQEKLSFTMQLISGTPPQIFGGAGDPNVQTKGGQEQQLNTGMGKLELFWKNMRWENVAAAENSVECGAKNYTQRLTSVETGDSGQYMNEYVELSEMRGAVHAYPDTDQGFPMTRLEEKAFWDEMFQAASTGKNPYAEAVLDDPENQERIANSTGVQGIVIPGQDMRSKCLRTIDLLLKAAPSKLSIAAAPGTIRLPQQNGPDQMVPIQAGDKILPEQMQAAQASGVQMTEQDFPSIVPDKNVDDMDIIIKTVEHWGQKDFDTNTTNPDGYANVIAYKKIAEQFASDKAKAQAMAAAPPQGPGQPPATAAGAPPEGAS